MDTKKGLKRGRPRGDVIYTEDGLVEDAIDTKEWPRGMSYTHRKGLEEMV